MPVIYLSPSTQEYNPYINGGSEELWMNRLADAMEPLLIASGISFSRNTPDMTAASSIRASNAGSYDLHLSLHSNASGAGTAGTQRGILAFYYPGSIWGQKAADLLVDGLKSIYPLPNRVRSQPTTAIGEVAKVRAPAVLLELGFHDNWEDASWIVTNIDAMARAIVLSLTEYFGIPFFSSCQPIPGTVRLDLGALNVRSHPSHDAKVIARLYDGAQVTILNEYNGWYLIQFGGITGYAAADFILVG